MNVFSLDILKYVLVDIWYALKFPVHDLFIGYDILVFDIWQSRPKNHVDFSSKKVAVEDHSSYFISSVPALLMAEGIITNNNFRC